jgi:hypothetical protein
VVCSTRETRFTDADGRRCDGALSSEAAYSSASLLLGYPRCTEHLTPEDVEEGLDDRLNYPRRLDARAATFVFVNVQHLLAGGATGAGSGPQPANPAAARGAGSGAGRRQGGAHQQPQQPQRQAQPQQQPQQPQQQPQQPQRRPPIDAQLLRRAPMMQLAAVVAPAGGVSPLQEGEVADAQVCFTCVCQLRSNASRSESGDCWLSRSCANPNPCKLGDSELQCRSPCPPPPQTQAFPACLWEARDGQPPAKGALGSFADWLMQQHELAHGADAPASDIVLLLHYAPYGAPLLAAALEREGVRLPPVRVADSCLLAKYALSEVQAAQLAASVAGGSGSGAQAGSSAAPLGSPRWQRRPHLRHPAGLKALVASHCPQWLASAPWYRPLESALSDARCALVATAALSSAAWGADDAWRAFALGMSAPAADVFGRAGYPLAAALASRALDRAQDGSGGSDGGGAGRGGGAARVGGAARGRRGGRARRGRGHGRGEVAADHGIERAGTRSRDSSGPGDHQRGRGGGRRGGRSARGRTRAALAAAGTAALAAASLLSPLTTRAGRRHWQEQQSERGPAQERQQPPPRRQRRA